MHAMLPTGTARELLWGSKEMRAILTIGLMTILALQCYATEVAARHDSISITIQVQEPVFHLGSDIDIRITIDNDGDKPCQPIYLDPGFSSVEIPNRPASVIRLDIVDAEGHYVSAMKSGRSDSPAMSATNFFLLDCWQHYGMTIRVSEYSAWRYALPGGKYRVRARMVFATRSYVMRHPKLFEELERSRFVSREELESMLPEGEYVSDWAEFRVD
jgi:hypothetical protein